MSLSNIIIQILKKNYVLNDGIYLKSKTNSASDYVKNYGIQWDIFQLTQFDSYTKNKTIV